MSEKKKTTWEDAEKIFEGFRSLWEALLEIEPYGVQWKALELLKEAREETSYALLFADAENPFLTDEAKNKMKLEYLEREAKRLRSIERFGIERDAQGGPEMTYNELERMLYNLAGDLEDIIERVQSSRVEPEPKPESKRELYDQVMSVFEEAFNDEDPRLKCYIKVTLTNTLLRRGIRIPENKEATK